MTFYVGLHQPSDAHHFDRSFISVNRLRDRRSDFRVRDWILDSGAFSELARFGRYREPVEIYASRIDRWCRCGNLLAAVTQDYMCEPFMLAKTGLSVAVHQQLTIQRYNALRSLVRDTYVMPVLQGYRVAEYIRHLELYGRRLRRGAWVGVGSICKRNRDVGAVYAVLKAIRAVRPDLRLHGFGLKATALADRQIHGGLHSADSMAWSFRARRQRRNPNDWREARQFERQIVTATSHRSHA
jgi:hypothetical protein